MELDRLRDLLSGNDPSGSFLVASAGARLFGLGLALPAFAARAIPVRFRLGFAVVILALACGPALAGSSGGLGSAELGGSLSAPHGLLGLSAALAAETAIGACFGGLVLVVFAAARAAAGILSDQIGFGVAGFAELEGDDGEYPLGRLQDGFAAFLFFGSGVHLAFARAFWHCFRALPPGSAIEADLAAAGSKLVVLAGSSLFEAAFRLALPVLGLLFLTTVLQGIVSRIIPEVELFVFGFPVRFAVGILGIAILLPYVAGSLRSVFEKEIERGQQMILALLTTGG